MICKILFCFSFSFLSLRTLRSLRLVKKSPTDNQPDPETQKIL